MQMKYQEEFFHSQIEDIHEATEEKEKLFEKLLQEERSKARRFDVDSGTTEDRKMRCVANSQLHVIMPYPRLELELVQIVKHLLEDGNAPSQCKSCQELKIAFGFLLQSSHVGIIIS